MKLHEILARLRHKSAHPCNLPGACYLGSGMERKAFKVGRYVVKGHSDYVSPNPAKSYRFEDGTVVTTVQTRRVGRWDVQPYAGPMVWDAIESGRLSDNRWRDIRHTMCEHRYEQRQGWTDFHPGNVALASPKRFVQFD